jgi:hypothetical protein
MPRRKKKDNLSNSEIVSRILRGANDARNTFKRMTSKEFTLDDSSEGFVQTFVAAAIGGRKTAPWVTVESSVAETLADAEAERRGRKSKRLVGGRFDAVVWWKSDAPRAVIEFKNGYFTSAIKSDAKRLRQVLRKAECLSAVFIVVTLSAIKQATLTGYKARLKKHVGSGWTVPGMTKIKATKDDYKIYHDTTIVLQLSRSALA